MESTLWPDFARLVRPALFSSRKEEGFIVGERASNDGIF